MKGQTRDPNTLRAQYLENSWRCYLETIANYEIVCCVEAARSAILATAWLLVYKPFAAVDCQLRDLSTLYVRCAWQAPAE